MELKKLIYDVPDFPQKGVVFKDITPLLNNVAGFHYVIEEMAKFAEKVGANVIVAPEARGFIFGAPVAYEAKTRFVPVRKPGKLPRAFKSKSYELEYGAGTLEIHADSLKKGDRVLIVDDVLATGGTLVAIEEIVQDFGAKVAGISVLLDLTKLHPADIFNGKKFQSLIKY